MIWPPIPGLSLTGRRWVYRVEVGWRAAARTESLPRDLRWWRGLW